MDTPRSLMHDLLCFRSSDAKRMFREGIKARDGHKCVYCGSSENLTLDHVRPKSHGGTDTADNCVTACRPCHPAKGSMHRDVLMQNNGAY